MWLHYEDFIYLLRERSERWAWWINTDGEIRTEREDGEELDPLTAMLATIQQRFVDLSSYNIAARYLGIDPDTADAIAEAADLAGSYNAHVRADLCDALALEEPWGRQGRWEDRAFTAGPYPHQYDRPLRRGSGSAGFASAATWKAPSRFMRSAQNVGWRSKRTVTTGAPADAVSISSGCGAPRPAGSSAFSVAGCRPGCASWSNRAAAD